MKQEKIEVTKMSVKDVDALGKKLIGDWHVKCIAGKTKSKDRVWLVKDTPRYLDSRDVISVR